MRRVLVSVLAIASAALAGRAGVAAQRGGPPAPPPQSPRAAAPIDLTGYWVSVVTEDWRWRMLTPPRGDYASVPLNPAGKRVADSWDPAKEASDGCKPYGAAALMRVPGRLHITWQDDATLKIETDAGRQVRLLHFRQPATPGGERSWQGYSAAEWETIGIRGGAALGGARGAPPPRVGSLKVVTTNLRAGYLRRNGVPYSEDVIVTEYFDRLKSYDVEWLTVLTQVDDPTYLTQPFITSTHFKREPDGSRWMPTRCE